MRFLGDDPPGWDLTYDDVFMVPRRSSVSSRYDVDLSSADGTGTTLPLVVANMTAVSGRRMAETMARRGGMSILPQDIPLDVVAEVTAWVKSRHPVFETPITLSPHETVGDALALLPKRAHRAAFVVDDGRPVGSGDRGGLPRRRPVHPGARRDDHGHGHAASTTIDPRAAFDMLASTRHRLAPVVDADRRAGRHAHPRRCAPLHALRPAARRRRAAPGRRRDRGQRRREGQGGADWLEIGVDCLVVDTAHGHQERMVEALAAVRSAGVDVPVVAGNVVSAEGVRTWSTPAPTSSRSASVPARCAPPG